MLLKLAGVNTAVNCTGNNWAELCTWKFVKVTKLANLTVIYMTVTLVNLMTKDSDAQ